MMMVTASLSFRVQPHKRGEVLSAMEALLNRMRGITGCSRTRLFTDVEDESSFTLASEWRDAYAAAGFFESREFHIFCGIRILLRDEPRIVLDEIQARVTRPLRNH